MYTRLAAVLLIALAFGGTWWHGYSKGKAHDKARSDLVIANMVAEAKDRLDKANALIRQQSDQMQANKERAERDLQSERSRADRRIADQRATDALVREQLAGLAGGPGADQDSVAACISRSKALGVVLANVLSDLGTCAENAEHEAANARALLDAWPSIGSSQTSSSGKPSAAPQAPQ